MRLALSTRFCDGFTREDYETPVGRLYSGALNVFDDISAMPETVVTVIK